MPRRDYGSSYNSSGYNYGGDTYSSNSGGNRSGGRYDDYYSGYYGGDSSSGYGTGMSSFGTSAGTGMGSTGFGNFDKLQEQLNLRESQLAMASNLLEQQSRLIADVSSNFDRGDRRSDRRGNYGYDRKRPGSDNRNDNKRRRTDSGSYGDDRRDGRRGYGGRQGGGGGGGSRAARSYGGGGGGRQGNFRQGGGGGGGGRGSNAPRNRDRRGGGGNNRSRRPGNRRNSQGDNKNRRQQRKPKIVPRVSKDLSRHYCHICEVECFNERNYQNHLSGTRHKEKFDELDDNPTRKAEVEERIKKQEEERSKPLPVKEAVDHCDICDLDIHVSLSSHLRFKQHRHRETQVKRGCAWCNVGGFSNFSEVLAHRLTDQHREMREQFGGRLRPDTVPKPEYTEEDQIPAFVENTPNGKDYVVPVTGFFCKLCNKFYKKEEAAKQNHCSSESHYEKWKQAKLDGISEYRVKLAEQKEREEAAMKKIEEQAKKREEEQNAAGTEENATDTKMDTDGEVAAIDTETMDTETVDQVGTVTEEGGQETEEPYVDEDQLLAEDAADQNDDKVECEGEPEEWAGDGEVDQEEEEEQTYTEEEKTYTPTRRGTRAGRGKRGRGRK